MQILEREPVLDALRAGLREADAGRGRLVLLAAEAGGGKTTVVQQVCASLNGHVRFALGNCDPLSTPRPLGPLLDIAAMLGGEIETLLEEMAPRDRIFRALLTELSKTSGPPTLAVFEDVHWADEATVDLLRFVGRRIASTRSVLLVTYRDDEGRFPIALGDLGTSSAVRRLSLAPLSETAVRVMSAGSGLDPVALHRRTGGNPFFVTEILDAANSENPNRLPDSVRDVVLARVARLSAAARGTLETCAVVGPRAEIGMLAELPHYAPEGLDECLAMGLLKADGLSLMFRNELGRETVIESIPPARRVALHSAVLTLLRQRPHGPDDLAQLAHHAEACGEVEAVLEFAPAAGRRAASLSAHREAVAQYQRALRVADRLEPAQRGHLLEALADEYWVVDQVPAAIETRLLALEVWRSLGDRLRQGDCLRNLQRYYWFAARGEEAVQALTQALDILTRLPPGPELAWAYNGKAMERFGAGDFEQAVLAARQAIALAKQFERIDIVAYGKNTLGCALCSGGDRRGLVELEESIALAREADLEADVVRGYANLTDCLANLPDRDLGVIGRHLQDGITYADDHELRSNSACMSAHLSEWFMFTGDWNRAGDMGADVVRNGSDAHRLRPLTVLGRLRARRGDPDAQLVLDEALDLTVRIGESEWIGLARAARAEAAWLAGKPEQTLLEARAGLDCVRHTPASWLIGELAYWCWKSGDTSPLPESIVEPYALQIAGMPEEAAACWRSLGYAYEAARALSESDGETALRDAREAFERLGAGRATQLVEDRLRSIGARGPRASTRANPAGLTDRELNVLALLAEDLRNAEIADRLSLSTRTVDHHVSAILAKIGARSRAEATRFATHMGIGTVQDRQPAAAN